MTEETAQRATRRWHRLYARIAVTRNPRRAKEILRQMKQAAQVREDFYAHR